MQLIAGRTAQEFNNRKDRRGAYWEDRYHATAVQTDEHLAQCITYIDLNMIRAGVVRHPSEWDVGGYQEIQRPWRRKRVIDFSALCKILHVESIEQLATQLNDRIVAALATSLRQPFWTESVGVGDGEFLNELRAALGAQGMHRQAMTDGQIRFLKEDTMPYIAKTGPKTTN